MLRVSLLLLHVNGVFSDILIVSFDGASVNKRGSDWMINGDSGGKSTVSFTVDRTNQVGMVNANVYLREPGFLDTWWRRTTCERFLYLGFLVLGFLDLRSWILDAGPVWRFPEPEILYPRASGFIKATYYGLTPDVSNCQNLVLNVNSKTNYTGYRVSFSNPHLNSPWGNTFAYGYKSNFQAPVGEFADVTLPFTGFSNHWDYGSGEPITTCAKDPQACPTARILKDMQTLSIWAEGVKGDVYLEVKSIRASGCKSSSSYDYLNDALQSMWTKRGKLGSSFGALLFSLGPGLAVCLYCLVCLYPLHSINLCRCCTQTIASFYDALNDALQNMWTKRGKMGVSVTCPFNGRSGVAGCHQIILSTFLNWKDQVGKVRLEAERRQMTEQQHMSLEETKQRAFEDKMRRAFEEQQRQEMTEQLRMMSAEMQQRALQEMERRVLQMEQRQEVAERQQMLLEEIQQRAMERELMSQMAQKKLEADAVRGKLNRCGADLQWLPKFNDRPELVYAAVSNYGLALEHAGFQCKDDEEIVMAAVTNAGEALKFVPDKWRKDIKVAMRAAAQNANALAYIRPPLQKHDPNLTNAAKLLSQAGEDDSITIAMSVRFAFNEKDLRPVSTNIALELGKLQNPVAQRYRVFYPSVLNCGFCGPRRQLTDISHTCRGDCTRTCSVHGEHCSSMSLAGLNGLKGMTPECQRMWCWRTLFRRELRSAKKSGGCMLQIVEWFEPKKSWADQIFGKVSEPGFVLGLGQKIECQIAEELDLAVLRIEVPSDGPRHIEGAMPAIIVELSRIAYEGNSSANSKTIKFEEW